MLDVLQTVVTSISGFFWGPPLFIAVLGTGIYYTIAFKGAYQLKIGHHLKNTFGTMFTPPDEEGEGTISGFAAAAVSISSVIGVGNIAGPATALTMGGPGAVFWMWITAIVGMSTKAAEVLLGQRYRVYFEGIDEYLCGRNYVIRNGLGWLRLAQLLAWVVVFTPWSMLVQTNAVATSIAEAFNIPVNVGIWFIFITLAVTIIGGVRRIAAVADKVVPAMAIFYIGAGIILVAMNLGEVPRMFSTIVSHAFTPYAGAGAVAGASVAEAMRFGVARGVYSNEAGMGTAMGVHSAAIVDHPVRQASWGFSECLIDTLLVCSITVFAIMATGANFANPEVTGAALVTVAWQLAYGYIGGVIVAVATAFFSWTTLLTAYYNAEKGVNFLLGDSKLNRTVMWIYMAYYLGPQFFAGADTGLLWMITDTILIISVASSIAALLLLRKPVVEMHYDFWDRYLPALEAGENPPRVSYRFDPASGEEVRMEE